MNAHIYAVTAVVLRHAMGVDASDRAKLAFACDSADSADHRGRDQHAQRD